MRFSIVLELGGHYHWQQAVSRFPLEVTMTDDTRWNDWANNAARLIGKNRDDKRLNDQLFVAEDKLRRQQAPLLWAQIRSDMKIMCDALNAKLSSSEVLAWDSARSNEAIIRIIQTGDTSRATFDPETTTLRLESSRIDETYVSAVGNGSVWFASGNVPHQSHEIAKRFMDAVVRGIP
jgi:hypothetical protein